MSKPNRAQSLCFFMEWCMTVNQILNFGQYLTVSHGSTPIR